MKRPFWIVAIVVLFAASVQVRADFPAISDSFAIIALVDDGGGGGWVPPSEDDDPPADGGDTGGGDTGGGDTGGGDTGGGDTGGGDTGGGGGDSGPSQREVLDGRIVMTVGHLNTLNAEIDRLLSQERSIENVPMLQSTRQYLSAVVQRAPDVRLDFLNGYVKQGQEGPVLVQQSTATSARFRENQISFAAGTASKLAAIQAGTANAMSPTVGDPIRLGDGSFVHQEEGLRLPFFDFAIDTVRYYSSSQRAMGRFGRGWTSLFEWRVIRGYTPVPAATVAEIAVAYELLPLIESLAGAIDGMFPADFTNSTLVDILSSTAAELLSIAPELSAVAVEFDELAQAAHSSGYPDLALEAETNAAAARAEAEFAVAIAQCFELIVVWTPSARHQRDELIYSAAELIALLQEIEAMILAAQTIETANTEATFPGQDPTLSHTGFDTLTLIDPWGQQLSFALVETLADGQRRFTSQAVGSGDLYESIDGTYTVRAADRSELRFGSDGLLREVADSYNNWYRITYQAGSPRAITDSAGREILIQTEARGTIIALRYADTEYRYHYDAGGYLRAQHPPTGAATEYSYTDGRLTRIARGSEETTITYQTVAGQVRATVVRLPSGGIERVAYQDPQVVFTDADGITTGYEITNGLVTSRCDALGTCTRSEYNAQGQETWRELPDGSIERRQYDAQGRVILHELPGGEWRRATYNEFDKPEREWNSLGSDTRFSYNHAGRLVETRDALGGWQRLTLDERGSRAVVATSAGVQLQLRHNAAGLPTEMVDVDGVVETLAYDAWGRPMRRTLNEEEQVAHSYDASGNILSTTTPAGTTHFSYDALGRLVLHTAGTGAETGAQTGAVTSYLYDSNAHPNPSTVEITHPDGARETRYFTPAGRPVGFDLPNGARYRLTYDERGFLATMHEQISDAQWFYRHDAAGNLLEVRDPSGETTRAVYDGQARVVALYTPTGGEYAIQWAGDRPRTVRTPDGMTIEYQRDALQRPIEVIIEGAVVRRTHFGTDSITTTDPNGHNFTVVHDPLRRPVMILYPDGTAARMTYDDWGRQRSLVSADGGRTAWDYDPAGRLIAIRYPDGRHVAQEYAAGPAGGVVRTTRWSDGHTISEHSDALERIVAIEDNRYGNQRRWYPDRSTTVIEDPAFGRIEYRTDTLERPTAITHNGVIVARFTYPNFSTVIWTDALGRSWQTGHDAAARTRRITEPDGSTVTYTLNAAARVSAAVTAAGSRTEFSYDSRGNLSGVQGPTASVANSYNNAMQVDSIVDQLGERRLVYGANGLLRAITTHAITTDGDLLRFDYDTQRRLTAEHRDGLTLTREYDRAGKITALQLEPYEVQMQIDYATGSANPAEIRVADRSVRFSYDAVGRPRRVQVDGIEQLSFSYDDAGRAARIAVNGQLSQRYWYNQDGRLAAHAVYDARTAALVAARVYHYNLDGTLNASAATTGQLEFYDYDRNARLAAVIASYSAEYAPALRDLFGSWLGAGVDLDIDPLHAPLRETVPIDVARREALDAVAQRYLEPAASNLLSQTLAATHGIPIRFEHDADGNRRAVRTPLFDLQISTDADGATTQVGALSIIAESTRTAVGPTTVLTRDALFGYPLSVATPESRQEWTRDHRGEWWRERITTAEEPAQERVSIAFALPQSPVALALRSDQPIEFAPTRIERAAPLAPSSDRSRPGEPTSTTRLGATTTTTGAVTFFLGNQPILIHRHDEPLTSVAIARDQFGRTIATRSGGGDEPPVAVAWLPGGLEPDPFSPAQGAAPTVSAAVQHAPTRFLLPVAGAFLETDPALAGINWRSYAGGDPLNYFDPTGLIVAAVSTDLQQNKGTHASRWLGRSGLETIGQSGCVLVAYTRIIQAIDPAGEWTIERTNKVAVKHDLFIPDPQDGAKNNLGPQSIADLVRITTGHEINIQRHSAYLEDVVRQAHAAEETLWAIGGIQTHPVHAPTARYAHTLNVVVQPDGGVGFADTSARGRETLGLYEELRHVDLVRVVQAPPGATPHCQR